MKDLPPGLEHEIEIIPQKEHLASSLGNLGVDVVSTPALIGYLEMVCHTAILPFCQAGEATVGTRVEVDHLAAAMLGKPILAKARLLEINGRKLTFAVEARQGGRVVMSGRHGRAIIDLARFLAKPPSR
ncbi:MAG TPA: thioesterase family protein [Stellaceae bacterium]|nr:thioesterase family protein [Stellaceae bacterium]